MPSAPPLASTACTDQSRQRTLSSWAAIVYSGTLGLHGEGEGDAVCELFTLHTHTHTHSPLAMGPIHLRTAQTTTATPSTFSYFPSPLLPSPHTLTCVCPTASRASRTMQTQAAPACPSTTAPLAPSHRAAPVSASLQPHLSQEEEKVIATLQHRAFPVVWVGGWV